MKPYDFIISGLIIVMVWGCGGGVEPAANSTNHDDSAAVQSQPIEVDVYDIECNLSRFAKVDIGKTAKLYLVATGANPNSHRVVVIGNLPGVTATFNQVQFTGTQKGSFPVKIAFQRIDRPSTYEVDLTFLVTNPLNNSQDEKPGFFKKIINGITKGKDDSENSNLNQQPKCLNNPPVLGGQA